jgi:hypothetical protein
VISLYFPRIKIFDAPAFYFFFFKDCAIAIFAHNTAIILQKMLTLKPLDIAGLNINPTAEIITAIDDMIIAKVDTFE